MSLVLIQMLRRNAVIDNALAPAIGGLASLLGNDHVVTLLWSMVTAVACWGAVKLAAAALRLWTGHDDDDGSGGDT